MPISSICEHNTQPWDRTYIILHPICSSQCFGLLPIHFGSFQFPPPPPTLTCPSPPPLWVPPPCCLPLLPTPPDQSLTQEKLRQMFQEHTTALRPTPPTPPICTGSAVNPRKELTIQARTHAYKEHRCPNLYWLNSCPTEWTTHTHWHTYTHIYTPNAAQIPSVSLIVATLGSGLVSASRAAGSLWAAGLANPAAGGYWFSN